MASVRLRLLFPDRRLLSKNQRANGLRRCWVLVRPEMSTVGDLADTVYRRFNLRRSCPHGIFFKIDGFVVPSFESTCIFRDKDLVSVHKIGKKKKLITGRDENQHTEILAIESREKIEEKNTIQNETLCLVDKKKSKRKLKDLEKPECSKKKKRQKLNKTPEKPIIIQENSENVLEEQSQDSESSKSIHENQNEKIHEIQNEDSESTAHTSSDSDDKKSSPIVQVEQERNNQQEVSSDEKSSSVEQERNIPLEVSSDERSSPVANNGLSSVQTERKNQMEVSSDENRTQVNANQERKKMRRSTRRRQAQREFKRELKRIAKEKKESDSLRYEIPSNSNQEIAWKDSREIVEKEIVEKPSVVVPVVIRPGHIRFESDDDDEGPSNKQRNVLNDEQINYPMENLQWNGITNKTKGQKWGQGSKRKNEYNNESNWASSNWENENYNENNIHFEEINTNENGKEKAFTKELNIESLSVLTRSPKEGDIIVYQVVELSPITFCPEVSSHRVGEVKMYDPVLNKIILAPVPEYPIFPEKCEDDLNEDETENIADLSIYKEDGSLEIEYGALLDLRLLKDKENNAESASRSSLSKKSKQKSRTNNNNSNSNNWENNASINNDPVYNNNWTQSNINGNQQDNTNNWETESINVPKGNVEKQTEQNGWEKWAPNTSAPSWSYHAIRGSALGPTIALLRGNENSTRENSRGRGRGRRGRGGGRRGRGY